MEQKSSGVACRDRKAVQKILKDVQSVVKNQIDAHVATDDAAKERLYKRCVEIYESSLHENLMVDGVPWPVAQAESSDDVTTEVEAEDEHLKAEHSQLQQEVDGMIIAVSKKRKHCPHQTVVQLANTCRAQCSYVKKARMEPDVPTVSVEGLSQPLQHCQSEEQVKETQQKINKLIKNLPPVIEVVHEVEKAQRLHNQQVTSTDRLLFSPSWSNGL